MQLTGYVKSNTAEEQLKAYYRGEQGPLRPRRGEGATHRASRTARTRLPWNVPPRKRSWKRVRAEIAAGKLDFAMAAKKHSHCPSGPTGGDIGLHRPQRRTDGGSVLQSRVRAEAERVESRGRNRFRLHTSFK